MLSSKMKQQYLLRLQLLEPSLGTSWPSHSDLISLFVSYYCHAGLHRGARNTERGASFRILYFDTEHGDNRDRWRQTSHRCTHKGRFDV